MSDNEIVLNVITFGELLSKFQEHGLTLVLVPDDSGYYQLKAKPD